MTSSRRRRASALAVALFSPVALAACGSSTTTAAAPTTAAASTAAATTTAPLPADKPTAIISLSPTATEILFAIGAGPQVLAVDDQSNYPANVPKSRRSPPRSPTSS
jgi:iron complex transport system substrate-binding protein